MAAEPISANSFSVTVENIELSGNFSAVSGLTEEIVFEEYSEGGNYLSPILLPKGIKHSNIVLKRGTVSKEPLTEWFAQVKSGIHKRYTMTIRLTDSRQNPVKTWTVMEAMPVRIEYSPFDALERNVSLVTVELVHGEIIEESAEL